MSIGEDTAIETHSIKKQDYGNAGFPPFLDFHRIALMKLQILVAASLLALTCLTVIS